MTCCVCGKSEGIITRISDTILRCEKCTKEKFPPLLILVKFGSQTVTAWWNTIAMKDEKVTDFSMFASCGWFLRARKDVGREYSGYTGGIRNILYFEYFGNYKCIRIPASIRGLYTGDECHMQICQQMTSLPHAAPQNTSAWKDRPCYFKERSSLL